MVTSLFVILYVSVKSHLHLGFLDVRFLIVTIAACPVKVKAKRFIHESYLVFILLIFILTFCANDACVRYLLQNRLPTLIAFSFIYFSQLLFSNFSLEPLLLFVSHFSKHFF